MAKNPFEEEPVVTADLAAALVGTLSHFGFAMDGGAALALAGVVKAVLTGFVRSRVTPDAHLPSAPPAAGPLGAPPAPAPPVAPAPPPSSPDPTQDAPPTSTVTRGPLG